MTRYVRTIVGDNVMPARGQSSPKLLVEGLLNPPYLAGMPRVPIRPICSGRRGPARLLDMSSGRHSREYIGLPMPRGRSALRLRLQDRRIRPDLPSIVWFGGRRNRALVLFEPRFQCTALRPRHSTQRVRRRPLWTDRRSRHARRRSDRLSARPVPDRRQHLIRDPTESRRQRARYHDRHPTTP